MVCYSSSRCWLPSNRQNATGERLRPTDGCIVRPLLKGLGVSSAGPSRPRISRRQRKRANGDRARDRHSGIALLTASVRALAGSRKIRRFCGWILPGEPSSGSKSARDAARNGRRRAFPAAIVPRQRWGAVVAIDRRQYLFNFGDRFDTLVVPEPNQPDNRLNEAAADPQGRLWVGTMQNNIAADGAPKSIEGRKGSLYRIEASGECRRACDDAFAITNTLVWRDNVLITADTLAGELYAYDYDPASGHIGDRRLFQPSFAIPTGRVSMLRDIFGTRDLAIVACFVSTYRANSIASCSCRCSQSDELLFRRRGAADFVRDLRALWPRI